MMEVVNIEYTDRTGRRVCVVGADVVITSTHPERSREKGKGGRRPYLWGKSGMLRCMEAGETVEVSCYDRDDYLSWRSIASHLKCYGVMFTTHRDKINSTLLITRTQ